VTDPITAFMDFMHSVDCPPDPSEVMQADDKIHRFRLSGDKPKTQNGSYILRVDADGFAVGGCMNFRHNEWHKWHIKSNRKATDAERAAWRQKAKDAKAAQEHERAKEAKEAAERSRKIWADSEKSGSNAYLDRKGFTAEGLGCRMSKGKVVVPMWSDGKVIGVQFIDGDGDKLFIKGTAKEGSYHAIKGEGDVLIIGEGLTTMGAIHASIGCSVIVAFDAGNLKPVAKIMRKKYPEKRIVIAADGDQWTIPNGKRPEGFDDPAGDDPRWSEWREAGLDMNTGADKAAQAAVAIGGAMVVSPPIPADDPEKRTDWWDYWKSDGVEAVQKAFEAALREPEPSNDDEDERWEPDYEAMAGVVPDPGKLDILNNNPLIKAIHPLGRSEKSFYFFPRSCGQIMDFTGPALGNIQNLVTMAPRHMWETQFEMQVSEKKMANEASLMLIEVCNLMGIYDPETERGVGVWMDEGNQVFNAGDKLYTTDGVYPPPDYKSKNVYVMGPRVGKITDDIMTNAQAFEILKVCLSLSWKGKQSGYMLAGWIVSALIAGALRWRAHIVLTGEKGSGKSWAIEHIIKPLMGKIALARDGGTTEPRIRIDIGSTARPVIMDESESETLRDRTNMEQIFMLARKASSGSNMANFHGVYPIRSSFCFAAINPRIVQGADLDRNTILQLAVNKAPTAREDFREIERKVMEVIDDKACERLLSRCFHNLPVILKNIETFSDVLAQQEGSKRFGDQYGTLIAGAYSLTSTKEISREAATEWCARHDWRWAQEDNDQSDPERLLSYLLAARIRYDDRGMAREASVARLIDRGLNSQGLEISDVSIAALGDNGIKVDGDWLLIGSPCKPMSDILSETSWAGSYRRSLGELDGAQSREKVQFSPSMRLRCVAIPMAMVLDEGEDTYEEELPFGVEDIE
jgi:putative DNA primase/helicase